MEGLLLFIKHKVGFIWCIIENLNDLLFRSFYLSRLEKILPVLFDEFSTGTFQYRKLNIEDAWRLFRMIHNQPSSDLDFFKPHLFDEKSIIKQVRKASFLMMGVFDGEAITGYFFLRFFANRKCFVGRIIDKEYRGKGIGQVMNNIMYHTAWRMKFRCFSTISKNNIAVMKSHSTNRHMLVRRELKNDYLLVEFLPNEEQKGNK